MSDFDVNAYLLRCAALAEDFAGNVLRPERQLPSELYSAMRYSFFAGGKRIRPALAYAAAEAVSGDGTSSIPFGVAIEMIHTYSLIHDDLPSMDDDELRRGKPTCHVKYGEAMAILAGDALLADAFAMLTEEGMAGRYPADTLIKCIKEISLAAGGVGMVAGQAVDILSEGQTLDLPALEFLHTHKTGALIRASVMTGGLSAKASASELEALGRYADRVGLAFQVADDILDVVGDTETLGKPVGSDEGLSKATYPSVMGLAEARKRLVELIDEANEFTIPFGERGEPLRAIATFVGSRNN
ncbi:MAG: polyprenyl synthetase [Deltaproteobacteria bacterium]|nr:MAG: polyprenyl synthetase [Deltaproteobacteria bacterium]